MTAKQIVVKPHTHVFEYSIPIKSAYSDGAFYKTLLFKEQKSKADVIAHCRYLIDYCHSITDGTEHDFEAEAVIVTLEVATEWPCLTRNMIQTNTFTDVPGLVSNNKNRMNGKYPVSVYRREVF
jgi:hypothetical protein